MWKCTRATEFSLYGGTYQQRELVFLKGVWLLLSMLFSRYQCYYAVEMEMFCCGDRRKSSCSLSFFTVLKHLTTDLWLQYVRWYWWNCERGKLISGEKLVVCYRRLLEKQRTVERVYMTLGYFPTDTRYYFFQQIHLCQEVKCFVRALSCLCATLQSH